MFIIPMSFRMIRIGIGLNERDTSSSVESVSKNSSVALSIQSSKSSQGNGRLSAYGEEVTSREGTGAYCCPSPAAISAVAKKRVRVKKNIHESKKNVLFCKENSISLYF